MTAQLKLLMGLVEMQICNGLCGAGIAESELVYVLDDRFSNPGRGNMGSLLFATASKMALWPTHPSTHWVSGHLPRR